MTTHTPTPQPSPPALSPQGTRLLRAVNALQGPARMRRGDTGCYQLGTTSTTWPTIQELKDAGLIDLDHGPEPYVTPNSRGRARAARPLTPAESRLLKAVCRHHGPAALRQDGDLIQLGHHGPRARSMTWRSLETLGLITITGDDGARTVTATDDGLMVRARLIRSARRA